MNKTEINKAFHEAARKGEIDRMEDLRLQGADTGAPDENGLRVADKARQMAMENVGQELGRLVVLEGMGIDVSDMRAECLHAREVQDERLRDAFGAVVDSLDVLVMTPGMHAQAQEIAQTLVENEKTEQRRVLSYVQRVRLKKADSPFDFALLRK